MCGFIFSDHCYTNISVGSISRVVNFYPYEIFNKMIEVENGFYCVQCVPSRTQQKKEVD